MSNMLHVGGRAAVVTALLGLAACQSPDAAVVPHRPAAVSRYLTGAALDAVGANQQFQLAAPSSPNGERIISPALAKRLAMAYVRAFGQSYQSAWDRERGAHVDLATLAVAPRVYLAATPFTAVSETDVHPAFRRQLGSYYLLTLLNGSTPVVYMAVSALATDYSVDAQGQLVTPMERGMEILHAGIPVDGGFAPISPEQAAEMASAATGARVASVPELVLTGSEDAPLMARWKIDLDAEVPAVAGTAHRPVRSVYVGVERAARFAVGRAGAPRSVSVRVMGPGVGRARRTLAVPVRAGQDAEFEVVHFNGKEG